MERPRSRRSPCYWCCPTRIGDYERIYDQQATDLTATTIYDSNDSGHPHRNVLHAVSSPHYRLSILMHIHFVRFSWMSTAFYLPLYFQIIGWSATLSGLLVSPVLRRISSLGAHATQITPYAMGSSLVALVSGYIVSRQGKYKPIMVFGFAVNTLGLVSLSKHLMR